jgi:hypothetical protein
MCVVSVLQAGKFVWVCRFPGASPQAFTWRAFSPVVPGRRLRTFSPPATPRERRSAELPGPKARNVTACAPFGSEMTNGIFAFKNIQTVQKNPCPICRPKSRSTCSSATQSRTRCWRGGGLLEGGADEPMPTREEFDEGLQHAQAIYDFVLNLLPAEARP